jgi:hypothetical protein
MGNVNLNSACCDAGSPAGNLLITMILRLQPDLTTLLPVAYCLLPESESVSPAMQPMDSECVPVLDIAEYQLPVYDPPVAGIHGKRLFLQI